MRLCCLDLEGVLLPEFWIRIAKHFKNEKLRLTTRDIPDYDELMRYRLRVLREAGIRLTDIQAVIKNIKPLPGACAFLNRLRRFCPVVILSDTYYEFARMPMMRLGQPVLFCNWLETDARGFISGYVLRQRQGKKRAVKAFKNLGFHVTAVGDSFNDLEMLVEAHRGIFFKPPAKIRRAHPQLPAARDYPTLAKFVFRPC